MGNSISHWEPTAETYKFIHPLGPKPFFQSDYRRILHNRLPPDQFADRMSAINTIAVSYAPSRYLSLLPPVGSVIYFIVWFTILDSPTLSNKYATPFILFYPLFLLLLFIGAIVTVRIQRERFYRRIVSLLNEYNVKDTASGLVWVFQRELPLNFCTSYHRVACCGFSFTRLFCGIHINIMQPPQHVFSPPLPINSYQYQTIPVETSPIHSEPLQPISPASPNENDYLRSHDQLPAYSLQA